MPTFTLRFTGMALFVRHAYDDSFDEKVEVRFITKDLGGHETAAHHSRHRSEAPADRPELHQHVPILMVSTEAWNDERVAGSQHAGPRAPGHPVYLAHYDRVTILKNDKPLSGRVRVSGTDEMSSRPETDADWNNFKGLIVTMGELYPNMDYVAALARRVAPFAVLTLTGGRLGTGRPISPAAERPWTVTDRQTRSERTRYLTDVVAYEFDFENQDKIEISLAGPRPSRLRLASNRDANAWLVHQPFLSSLTRHVSSEIEHLHVTGSVMSPEPDLKRFPPIISLRSIGLDRHPDDPSCPPFQIKLEQQ